MDLREGAGDLGLQLRVDRLDGGADGGSVRGCASPRAALSRALAAQLRQQAAFVSVSNGEPVEARPPACSASSAIGWHS